MNKLYYGNGVCTIEGNNILAVTIRYTGAIEIDDKTPEDYYISATDKIISIYPWVRKGMLDKNIYLNKLFEYVGEFKILQTRAMVRGIGGVPVTTKRVMDYSELLESTSESLTVKSEDLFSSYNYGKRVAKTILKQQYIENLHTKTDKITLVDEGGNNYNGYHNLNLTTSQIMSGRVNDKNSINLNRVPNPDVVKKGKARINKKRRRKWGSLFQGLYPSSKGKIRKPQEKPLLDKKTRG